MPEVETLVDVVRVEYACEYCGGEMLPTGIVFTTYPATYEHLCGKCGCCWSLTVAYPTIRYVPREPKETPDA